MKLEIESLWIALETKGFVTAEEAFDQNTDVIVTLSTGERYVATFFTYQNILTLIKKNQISGEWLSGKYFWASDMLLIDSIDRASIEQVVEKLIADGCWPAAFRLIAGPAL